MVISAFGLAACSGEDAGTPAPSPEPAEQPREHAVFPKIESEVDEASRVELVEILRRPDPFERARLLGERLPQWDADRAITAEALLEDPTLNLDATAYDLLVRIWAKHMPAEASRWAVTRASMAFRTAAVLESMTQWAEVDPISAATAMEVWVASYDDLADVLRTGVVRGWYASGDLAGLEAYMIAQGPGLPRQRILSQIVRTRIQNEGAEPVVEWAESFPAEKAGLKREIYRQMASNLPIFDFEAAMGWCDRHCDGPYGHNLREIIARRWVRTDGASAIEWLASGYEGVGVDRDLDLGLRLAFARWTNYERDDAMAWGDAQTAGDSPPEWMTPILPVYVRQLSTTDPERAIDLASRLPDEDEREIVLTDIARIWLRDDPVAAEAWLATSPLSPEAREKARGPNKRRPLNP